MCCNVGGYGALSVWTFVWAVLMVLMNGMNGLLPCTQAMEAWGIHQECTAMEADFFVQQSVLFVTLFITYAVVAAMKPEKMTMVKVLAPWLVIGALNLAYFSVHGFGGQPCPPAVSRWLKCLQFSSDNYKVKVLCNHDGIELATPRC
jgi:hypothetical protein